MTETVLGLIGCGAAARRYYLPALKTHPEIAKRMIFVDRDLTTAKEMAEEVGSDRYENDYKSIIGKVQGVIIVVPNFLHFQVATDFLKGGSHVLCEKPLVEKVEEVDEMIRIAGENKVTISVNNTRRMFPSFMKIKELISRGDLGKLRSIKYYEGMTFAWPSLTGFYVDPKVSAKGVLMDIGSHVVDTICWWLDGKPELEEFTDDSFGGPESVACLKARKDECEIEIRFNRLNDLDNLYKITGELGYIEGNIFEWDRIRLVRNQGKSETISLPTNVKVYPDFVKPIVNNFIEVVSNSAKPLVSADDVCPSIALLEDAYSKRQRFNLPWYENLEAINV
ncbi:MAG: Gfo/Idh/MocA family protein [Calditrichaceae bacterium]